MNQTYIIYMHTQYYNINSNILSCIFNGRKKRDTEESRKTHVFPDLLANFYCISKVVLSLNTSLFHPS